MEVTVSNNKASVVQESGSAFVASCAMEQLLQLEALFDAIQQQLSTDTYAHTLAGLGQSVSSRYSAQMRNLAEQGGARV